MTKEHGFISRHKVLISLLAIIVLCLLLRFLHLFDSSHYYIISADSHLFHWISEQYLLGHPIGPLVSGHQIPTGLYTGLSYPLAWISIALSTVSGLSRNEALTSAAKFIPPVLGVIGVLFMYWMGSRMYSRRIGIFAALSWAIVSPVIHITIAGYIDRDALSVLLIAAGAFVFYISKNWRYTIRNLNVGWILATSLVAGIEFMLFLEWGKAGPLLLLAILMAYSAAVFLTRFYTCVSPFLMGSSELTDLGSLIKLVYTSITTAWREINWRPLVLILCLNILAALLISSFSFSELFDYIDLWFSHSGTLSTTSEAVGMKISDLFIYSFLSIAVLIGMYVTLRRQSHPDMLWLSWFIVFFFVGLFVTRRIFIIYAVVSGCMLSGLGLEFLYSFRPSLSYERLSSLGLGFLYGFPTPLLYERLKNLTGPFILIALLFLSLIGSIYVSYFQSTSRGMFVDNEWYDALIYLKDNTPEDAVIMTWWDYGYWILDISQRTPVVDNGYRPEAYIGDISQAYVTTQDSEAIEIIQKYNASYLIFSYEDIEILPVISLYGLDQAYGDGKSVPPELKDSLFSRALEEDFDSDGSFVVAYRNDEVIILSAQY